MFIKISAKNKYSCLKKWKPKIERLTQRRATFVWKVSQKIWVKSQDSAWPSKV